MANSAATVRVTLTGSFDAPAPPSTVALPKMLWSFGRCGYQDDALMRVMHSVAEKLADSCDRCGGRVAGHDWQR
jgi:hypothetical protein